MGDGVCGPTWTRWVLPSFDQRPLTVQVEPELDASFVRWARPDGTLVSGVYHAQPGDTVIAIFEKPAND